MPFNRERVAATYARTILRVVSGSEIAENGVINGHQVPLNADGRRLLEAGQVLQYAGVDEQVQIAVTGGTPVSGSFQLTFGAQQTAVIAYNATAAQVQAAFQALSTVGAGNAIVEGGPFPAAPMRITFVGALAGADQGAITVADTFSAGDVTITVLRAGAAPAAGANQAVKPAGALADSGAGAALVAGVLMHATEFWPEAALTSEADDAPVAMYTKNCHFAIAQLTGYQAAVSRAESRLVIGNCTFE